MGTEVAELATRRRNLTATATLQGWSGLMGVGCSTATSATLTVADPQGNIVNAMALTAGTYYPMPTRLTGNLTVTISGTADITVYGT
jgi:hypothetical protein